MTWKAAKSAPSPVAARATSAMVVESAGGIPIRRETASAERPRVRVATMASISQSVMRPKRRRPLSSSWPSWAIAEEGASTPVASAIATGKASSTLSSAP